MSAHKHRWQRLSDTALFCQCGQTKEVGAPIYPVHLCSHPCALPHYPAYPVQPYVWPTPYWGTVTTAGTVEIGSVTFDASDDNVTYTTIS